MAKQIKPQTAWAVFNGSGKLRGIDLYGRTKSEYTTSYFAGQYETNFKPLGWRCVRVRVEVVKPKKRSRR